MDGTDWFPPVSDHDLMTPNNDRIDIGVLGAGRMAEALVPHWVAAGHRVMIGGRTAAKTQALAEQLGASAGTSARPPTSARSSCWLCSTRASP